MVFKSVDKEYISPSVEVFDVACEAGFKNSTGELTFSNGTWDGYWYDTY